MSPCLATRLSIGAKLVVPGAFGGLGLGTEAGDTVSLLALLTEIGCGNVSLGRLYEGHVSVLQLIGAYGTRAQLERVATDVRDGRLLPGVWNTEAADGVTLAPAGAGRYRLSGRRPSPPARASSRGR